MKLLRVWINYINPNITKQANLKILNIPRETGNCPGKKKSKEDGIRRAKRGLLTRRHSEKKNHCYCEKD